jgi:hypothetical protein
VRGYVFSKDADLDLDEIWDFIAQDNIEAADRWIVGAIGGSDGTRIRGLLRDRQAF